MQTRNIIAKKVGRNTGMRKKFAPAFLAARANTSRSMLCATNIKRRKSAGSLAISYNCTFTSIRGLVRGEDGQQKICFSMGRVKNMASSYWHQPSPPLPSKQWPFPHVSKTFNDCCDIVFYCYLPFQYHHIPSVHAQVFDVQHTREG